jgi:putative radical SAM enzyme (TIGR03279 family)
MHKIEISKIQENSIAHELGIEPGDFLVSINEQEIHDVFDYRYYCADTELLLEIEKKNGECWQFDIEKDEMEDLGIEFTTSLLDEEKSCHNKCIFCFIDQLPGGMRETLYFKDDDARLSFLYGNYITMTNLSDDEINRIIRYRMSPVNISVHTTNPKLRVKMLSNRFAGDILEKVERFTSQGIIVNSQIVLCPGINDGEELDRTISDLTALAPELHSISVVPVGITRFREGLAQLTPFNKESASKVVDQIEDWQKKLLKEHGSRIVYLADELYIMAGRPLPGYDAYEDFPQIENGVGMVSSLEYEVNGALKELEEKHISSIREKTVSIATGVSVFEHFKKITENIERRIKGLKINVYPVENTFFGSGVTVTGLLTSCDLIRVLKDKELGEQLLLCKNMFKADTTIMLDDVTADELEDKLDVKIQIVESDGYAFIDTLVQS